MRLLKALTIGLGVLIVVATAVLVTVIVRRIGGATPVAGPIAVSLHEPEGTHITGIASVRDQLAVQLQGGGPDRVVLIDPRTGATVGRIDLRAP